MISISKLLSVLTKHTEDHGKVYKNELTIIGLSVLCNRLFKINFRIYTGCL